MKTVVICDDNLVVLRDLKEQVVRCITEPVQIKTFSMANKTEEYIMSGGRIDVLLLDIVLGSEDGIILAKRIQKNRSDIRIVFITGYLEQAKRIFRAGPVYFLVKPITEDSLKMVLENVLAEMEEEKQHYLTLQMKDGIRKINLKDIYYVESKIRVLLIHMERGSESLYMKMDELIEKLPDTFVRVHKSFLVNMDRICHFSSEGAILENDERIPVSRTRYKEAKKRFLEYCGNELMR